MMSWTQSRLSVGNRLEPHGADLQLTEIAEDHVNEEAARYGDQGDRTAVVEHAVYVDMASGERWEGREAIVEMLRRFYRQTFDVTIEAVRSSAGDGFAVFEATLVGTHVGEYAGVPGTGKPVRVPRCVAHRVEADAIVEGRVYSMRTVSLEQVGAA